VAPPKCNTGHTTEPTWELTMNRTFKTTSARVRALFAIAALAASSLVIGSIAGLADHYNAETYLAKAAGAVVAQR
jgi:hypothetical protein